MAKKKKTIVKNGKRVPASTKGKKPTAAAAPKPDKKAEKEKRKKAVAQAVWKGTEAHRTTIGKLSALVDTYDEYDGKASMLKDEIGGLKGQIAEDRAEIRRIIADEAPDEIKKLPGLEKDIGRREVQLANKQEERSGAKEAMKCAFADIRRIIKDGPGLFDPKSEEATPTGAGKAPSTKSPSPKPSDSASSSRADTEPSPSQTGTPPPSKSQAGPDVNHDAELKAVTCAEVLGADFPLAIESLNNAGVITLYDAAQKGKTWLRSSHGANILSNLVQQIFDRVHAIRHPEEQPVG